jgi:hypothetical protein
VVVEGVGVVVVLCRTIELGLQLQPPCVAFWAVFTFGGNGPAITAHGSLDLLKNKI